MEVVALAVAAARLPTSWVATVAGRQSVLSHSRILMSGKRWQWWPTFTSWVAAAAAVLDGS
jgi:hypothetical protein